MSEECRSLGDIKDSNHSVAMFLSVPLNGSYLLNLTFVVAVFFWLHLILLCTFYKVCESKHMASS